MKGSEHARIMLFLHFYLIYLLLWEITIPSYLNFLIFPMKAVYLKFK